MQVLPQRLQEAQISYPDFKELHPEEQILILARPSPKSIFMAYWLEEIGINRTLAGKYLVRMEQQGLIIRKQYDWSKYKSHKHPGARGFIMTDQGLEARKVLIKRLKKQNT